MELKDEHLLHYVDQRTDVLTLKIQQETKQLRSLSMFMLSMKKEIESFIIGVQKLGIILKSSLHPDNGWTESINILLSYEANLLNSFSKYAGSLGSIGQTLNEFTSKYEKFNKNLVVEANRLIEQTNNQKKLLNKAKEKYFKEDKITMSCTDEGIYKSRLPILEEAKKEYKDNMISFNTLLNTIKPKYIKTLDTWNKNEESKYRHIKVALSSLESTSNELAVEWSNVQSCLKKMIEEIPVSLELEKYIPKPKKEKNEFFSEVKFEAPETSDHALQEAEESVAKWFPNGASEEDINFEEMKFRALLKNETITEEEKPKFLNMARTKEGLHAVCALFFLISMKVELKDTKVFNILAELACIATKQLACQKFPEAGYLAAILSFGNKIFCPTGSTETVKSRIYIRDTLINEPIWRRKGLWNRIVEYKIARALEHFESTNKKLGKKYKEEENSIRNIHFKELSSIASEMAFFSIDINVCRDLILEYANKCNLDSEKLAQLLSDYEATPSIPRDEDPRRKDYILYSLEKREKERKSYGKSKITFVLGMSLNFVNDYKTLINLLIINKEITNVLRMKIYKLILRSNKDKVRFVIWKQLLHTKGFEGIYEKARAKDMANLANDSESSLEIIALDVKRSFYRQSEIDKTTLINILRAYAVFNPEVEYCQGMNCIAGFFYLLYKDESTVFNMMSTLISLFELNNLFKQDVPLLRMYFYLLNRLMAVYVPRLHAHFFEEGISATYFASPWFLTMFTSILQSPKYENVPPLLLSIFDQFLTKGIKALFKTSLFILEHFEEELMNLHYERIVQFLSELSKSEFFSKPEVIAKYKERIRNYNITSKLFNRLDEEYEVIFSIAKERINKSHPPKEPFKHYVYYKNGKRKGELVSVYFAN